MLQQFLMGAWISRYVIAIYRYGQIFYLIILLVSIIIIIGIIVKALIKKKTSAKSYKKLLEKKLAEKQMEENNTWSFIHSFYKINIPWINKKQLIITLNFLKLKLDYLGLKLRIISFKKDRASRLISFFEEFSGMVITKVVNMQKFVPVVKNFLSTLKDCLR